ncbi:hypothetical protein NFI96_027709, partial [Prochilodus magdalenae]
RKDNRRRPRIARDVSWCGAAHRAGSSYLHPTDSTRGAESASDWAVYRLSAGETESAECFCEWDHR